jgi:hypothetical protein
MRDVFLAIFLILRVSGIHRDEGNSEKLFAIEFLF